MSSNYIYVNRNDYQRNITNARNQGVKEAKAKIKALEKEAKLKEAKLRKEYEQRINAMMNKEKEINKNKEKEIKELKQKEIEYAKALGQSNLNAQQIKELQNNLKEVKQRQTQFYNDYAKQLDNTKQRAQVYMNQCLSIIEQLEQLEVDRFFPNELNGYRKQIGLAREDIKNQNYEAALAVVQVRFQDLSQLLSETLIRNSTFQSLLQQVNQNLSQLQQSLTDSKDREISYDYEDRHIEDRCDVDFWSYGDYDKLKEHVNSIQGHVDNLTLQDNEKTLEDILVAIEEDKGVLTQVVNSATDELIRSHIVENQSQFMHNELLSNGWSLDRIERKDRRQPTVLHYTDGSGDELTIVCSSGVDSQDMDIVLDIHGEDISDETRRDLKQGVIHRIIEEDKIKDFKESSECASTSKEFEETVLAQLKERKNRDH